jgi:hypothetical protein
MFANAQADRRLYEVAVLATLHPHDQLTLVAGCAEPDDPDGAESRNGRSISPT